MCQMGINADPKVSAFFRNYESGKIRDDPVMEGNTRGRVTFAMGGPNTRTTQFFISFRDNSNLDEMGFAPVGEVVEGMDVVDALYSAYGEGAPRGAGPFQQNIKAAGNEYLDEEFPNLSRVISATIQ